MIRDSETAQHGLGFLGSWPWLQIVNGRLENPGSALNLWKLRHSHPNMVLFCNSKMTDKLIFQGLLNFSLGHNSLSDDFNLWT